MPTKFSINRYNQSVLKRIGISKISAYGISKFVTMNKKYSGHYLTIRFGVHMESKHF